MRMPVTDARSGVCDENLVAPWALARSTAHNLRGGLGVRPEVRACSGPRAIDRGPKISQGRRKSGMMFQAGKVAHDNHCASATPCAIFI
jgi:hypothetical protein